MPKKAGKPLPPQPEEVKEVLVQQISADIGHDLKAFQSWYNKISNSNPVLRSPKFTGYHLFEEMDADAKVYNCMSTRKEAMLSRPVYVRSARPGDRLEDTKAALVTWNLAKIRQLVQKKREIQSHLDYGFSVSEIIFSQTDIKIPEKKFKKNKTEQTIPAINLKNTFVIADIKTKIPSAFGFTRAGELMIRTQTTDPFGGYAFDYSPMRVLSDEELRHFMVISHDPRFGNRYGWPLKASFFFDVLMKRAVKVYRMVFVEKYGMPYLKGTYPTGTKQNEQVQFEQRLRGLQKNSWIMTPEGFAIDFVDAIGKAGTVDVYQNTLDFCDGNISEVVLGHREATAAAPTGGLASAEVKEGALRQDKLESDAVEHDAAFNDQFIPTLIDLNFEPNGLYPYVLTDVESELDKNKRIFQYATASNMGVELSLSQFRDEMKFDEPLDEADILAPGGGDMQEEFQTRGKPGANTVEQEQGGTPGGENIENEDIAAGNVETKTKLAPRRRIGGGMTLTINL